MNRSSLILAVVVVTAGTIMFAGFGFAYDIYTDMENCQQMDAQQDISANCWSFPNKLFVAGGLLLGFSGIGLLAISTRRYQNHAKQRTS